MKLINKYFWLVAIVAIVSAISSCKKDLSSLDTNKIPGFSVDTTGMGVLDVFQFENLVVKPKISSNVNESDLSYTWKVNLVPNDTVFKAISTAKNLDVEITSVPNTVGKYYQLVYEVLDKSNGLKYITYWNLNVRNGFGEGLVVADSKDGANTDLNLIMAPLVTANYTNESIKRNIYSAINGKLIPGLVKQMEYYTDMASLFGITNNSVFKVKALDYTLAGLNDELFHSHSGTVAPQRLAQMNQGFIFVEKGTLSANYLAVNYKFSLPFDQPKFKVPDHIAVNGKSNVPAYLSFYDEAKGGFAYQSSIQSFGDRNMYFSPSVSGKAFDVANVPNKVNLAAGLGPDDDFLHLLKDKSTGNISLYVLNTAVSVYPDTYPPSAKAVYDLTNAPGISSAKSFVLYDDQRVMYYASGNKVYAVLFSGVTPVFEERYTAPAGEEITTLQIYQESDYPFGSKGFKPTNNKQLIMSTYKGSEGKVYILPLKNIGLGNVDEANVKTYAGFGKISAITAQK
jgi:hypothetical protein